MYAEKMIEYLIDCTLATVEGMVYKKSISKSEFKRQCSIAQKGIDYLGKGYSYKSRAKNVIENGGDCYEYYSAKRRKAMGKES